jgi:hypothetical protein
MTRLHAAWSGLAVCAVLTGGLVAWAGPAAADDGGHSFLEISKVLLGPRCANCHPDGDSPTQGDTRQLHDPPVSRGADGFGVVGMRCFSCHQDQNVANGVVPGAAEWHLAPRSMAWAGRSPQAICEQLKDPQRNGGRTPQQVVDHVEKGALVNWAWSPGTGRSPAPGTHAQLVALLQAWVDSGAACPPDARDP